MSRFVKMLSVSVVVVGLLMLGHATMSPLPISAATTALGGLAALWLFRSKPLASLAGGAGTGAGIGAAIHTYSHVFAGHTHGHVHNEVMPHIVGDATVGILIGLAALALPIVTAQIVRRASAN